MASKFKFEFPADLQREREAVFQIVREAVAEGSLETVRAAQERLSDWLELHPDDYTLWDAGEPLALLADALQAQQPAPTPLS